MKRNVFVLVLANLLISQGPSYAASSVDALIQKLEDKGILTSQDAAQLKDEIAEKEQTSQQSTFKSLSPSWLNGLKISGDMRLRYQSQERDVFHSTPINPHDRGRVRARLNLEDQINDKIKFVFGIGTDGTGGNNGSGTSLYNFNRSNNYSFGGNGSNTSNIPSGSFDKDFIVLNKAYAEYTPTADWKIDIGKMDNPIWEPSSASTERFLWDPNITPEGGVIQYQKKINTYITPFTTDGVFVINDTGHSVLDTWMYFDQVGIKGSPTEKTYYKLAGTWYDITNQSHQLMSTRGNDLTNSTLVNSGAGATTAKCAAGYGTSINGTTECYQYSYNALVGAIDLGINDPFGDSLPVYIPQTGVRGELIRNPESKIPSDQKNGWEMGAYVGNSAINGWGTWQLSGDYRVMERDAWMDVFPDFDQYTGDTNVAGSRWELDIGLMKNVWFDFNIFDMHVYKKFHNDALAAYASGNPNITNSPNREILYQADINMKF